MTETFTYDRATLYADYARAAGGFALTVGPLLLVRPAGVVAWALGGAAALFLLFALRTAQRHLTCIALDEQGLAARGPLGAAIGWDELRQVKLNYYSTRRDRSRGWMQLTVRGRGRGVHLESSVDGFDRIATRVAAVAQAKGLRLSPTTLSNFAALGIDTECAAIPAAAR